MNENELTLQVRNVAGHEITVTDPASYEVAAGFAKEIKAAKDRVKEFFAEPKQKAHEAHKSITAKERELLAPLEEAERLLKDKMGAYQLAERRRVEAEAERQRQEAEKLVTLAAEAEAAGETEVAAEAVALAALESAGVSYLPGKGGAPAGVRGVSSRQVWKFRVTDAEKVPRGFLIVNEAAIAGLARSFKDKPTMEIPGIEFYPEIVTSIRG